MTHAVFMEKKNGKNAACTVYFHSGLADSTVQKGVCVLVIYLIMYLKSFLTWNFDNFINTLTPFISVITIHIY